MDHASYIGHTGRGMNLIYSPLDANPAPFAHAGAVKRPKNKTAIFQVESDSLTLLV